MFIYLDSCLKIIVNGVFECFLFVEKVHSIISFRRYSRKFQFERKCRTVFSRLKPETARLCNNFKKVLLYLILRLKYTFSSGNGKSYYILWSNTSEEQAGKLLEPYFILDLTFRLRHSHLAVSPHPSFFSKEKCKRKILFGAP